MITPLISFELPADDRRGQHGDQWLALAQEWFA